MSKEKQGNRKERRYAGINQRFGQLHQELTPLPSAPKSASLCIIPLAIAPSGIVIGVY